MDTVVISGADGFIGSNLIKCLLHDHINVWAIIIPNSPLRHRIEGLPGVHIVECPLEQLHEHRDAFPLHADAFYHLAWQGVSPEDRNDLELQVGNISLSMACVQFAASLGVDCFILPGSTTEYMYNLAPINQDAVPSVSNAYGAAKLAVRFLCEQQAAQVGVGFIYAVVTSIYSAMRKDKNVIFYAIDELLEGRKPSLSSLQQEWNFIHIDDLCRAFLLIGDKGKPGRFYAVGGGENQPLYQFIYQIRDLINPSLPLGIGEVKSDLQRMTGSRIDLTALQKDTGFAPRISFSDGIRHVIKQVQADKRISE